MTRYIMVFPIIFTLFIFPIYSSGDDGFPISGTTYYYRASQKVPIADMAVNLYSKTKVVQQVKSDNTGKFVFNEVVPDTYSITTPTVYPYDYTRLDDVYFDKDEQIDIQIGRRRMLIVKTIDSYNKIPVAGVEVDLINNATGDRLGGGRTDQDGICRFWDLEKGEYRLQIGGLEYDKLEPVVFSLEEYTDLEFEVEKFITISGTLNIICGGEVSPAQDQFVRLREDATWRLHQLDDPLALTSIGNSTTDEDGRFEIELREILQPGTYYLTVWYKNREVDTIWDLKAGGYKEINIERGYDIDDVEFNLTLPKPAEIKGKITNPDGRPAVGASIGGRRYIGAIEGIGVDGFRIISDGDGQFGPQEVWPGLYRIGATYDLKPGAWYSSEMMELELLPGESKDISLTLKETSYTYQQLGQYYYYENDIPSALEALYKSIEIDPSAGGSYYFLALIAIDNDEIDKAVGIKEDLFNRIDENNVNYDYYLKLFDIIDRAVQRR